MVADRLLFTIRRNLLISGKQPAKPFLVIMIQALIERFLQRAALHISKLHAMLRRPAGIDRQPASLIFLAQFLIIT